MMVMVPTVWARAMLTRPIMFEGKQRKTGEILEVCYGIALQGLATGTFSCLVDENEKHAEAIASLQQWGPDSWFPPQVQTLKKFFDHYQAQRAEPAVPKNEQGETIQ